MATCTPDAEGSERFCKLLIRGLDYKTTKDTLKSYFEQWGKILTCYIAKEKYTYRSRGFAFIRYDKAYMVDNVQAARPHTVDNCEVATHRSLPIKNFANPKDRATVKRISVKNVANFGEDDLKNYFAQFGNVISCTFVKKETKTKTGCAFVGFDDYDAVDKIILKVNHRIKGKRVIVEKFLSRQEMEKLNLSQNTEQGRMLHSHRVDFAFDEGAGCEYTYAQNNFVNPIHTENGSNSYNNGGTQLDSRFEGGNEVSYANDFPPLYGNNFAPLTMWSGNINNGIADIYPVLPVWGEIANNEIVSTYPRLGYGNNFERRPVLGGTITAYGHYGSGYGNNFGSRAMWDGMANNYQYVHVPLWWTMLPQV